MSNYEPKPGQVTVWKNEKYTSGGNQPYAKGKGLDLNGKECDFTLWIPKSDKIKGFNLTITEPYQKPVSESKPVSSDSDNTGAQPEPDDLPF
jgi:hypothetical protein